MEEVKNTPAENQEAETKKTEPETETNNAATESETKNSTPEAETNNAATESETKNSEPEEKANNTAQLEDAELLKKIRNQIEYYFGDNNMRRDKFLIEQTKLDDGWVPLSVLMTFKILAALSKDTEVILKALEDSDLIEVSEDKKKVRRSVDKPLPTYDGEYLKGQEARTIYLKGFPHSLSIEDLKDYYNSDDIENIIMRKYTKDKQKFFKGSIFLQFKTLEAAKAFIEQESVKYKDTQLLKLWAKEYNAEKEKEKEDKQQKKIKNILSGESKEKSDKKDEGRNKKNFSKGCVMHISNIPTDFSREVIKEKVSEISEVAYIDHKTGNTEGWIRLQGENSAVELIKKLDDNKIKIQDVDIVCKLLEGEEEDAYFVKVQEDMNQHRFKRRDGGRRGGRRNFKRRHSPGREENGKRSRIAA